MNNDWKVETPVSFHRFREKLAIQMLTYSPKNRNYVGDERFRASTSQHKARRPPRPTDLSNSAATRASSASTNVTPQSIKEASRKRLCGDLCPLVDHMSSIHPIPNRNSKVCVVCGKYCYHVCMKCTGPDGKKGVAIHASPNLSGVGESGVPCYIHYHNTNFFGLARTDYKLTGATSKKDWKSANKTTKEEHYRKIRRVLEPSLSNRSTPSSITTGSSNSNRNNNNGRDDSSSVNWNNVI